MWTANNALLSHMKLSVVIPYDSIIKKSYRWFRLQGLRLSINITSLPVYTGSLCRYMAMITVIVAENGTVTGTCTFAISYCTPRVPVAQVPQSAAGGQKKLFESELVSLLASTRVHILLSPTLLPLHPSVSCFIIDIVRVNS